MIDAILALFGVLLAFIALLCLVEVAGKGMDKLLKRRWPVRRERQVLRGIRLRDSEKELVERAKNVVFLKRQAN